ncbi:hypothetical protein ACTFIZ_005864 [Dictyostelium cf. discoideum]
MKNKLNINIIIEIGKQVIDTVVKLLVGVYILSLSIGIILFSKVNLELEIVPEYKEMLKNIPIVVDLITLKNLVGVCLIVSIIVFVVLVIKKSTIGQSLLNSIGKVVLSLLCICGLINNSQIFQEINKYKDILYENKWFVIKQLYTITEKTSVMVQKINEYCILNNLQYTAIFSQKILPKIEKVGIEEIENIVKNEIPNIIQSELAKNTTWYSQITTKHVIIGAVVAVVLLVGGFYVYTAMSKAEGPTAPTTLPSSSSSSSLTESSSSSESNLADILESIRDDLEELQENVDNLSRAIDTTIAAVVEEEEKIENLLDITASLIDRVSVVEQKVEAASVPLEQFLNDPAPLVDNTTTAVEVVNQESSNNNNNNNKHNKRMERRSIGLIWGYLVYVYIKRRFWIIGYNNSTYVLIFISGFLNCYCRGILVMRSLKYTEFNFLDKCLNISYWV